MVKKFGFQMLKNLRSSGRHSQHIAQVSRGYGQDYDCLTKDEGRPAMNEVVRIVNLRRPGEIPSHFIRIRISITRLTS